MPSLEQWKAKLGSQPDFQSNARMQQAAPNAGDHYGHVHNIKLFSTWSSREACMRDKVHRANTAGIAPGPNGAYSVVLSGTSYEDKDLGNEITYTGTGGTDDARNGGTQVEDQKFTHKHNFALNKNIVTGHPVRVIRGSQVHSQWAPFPGHDGRARYRYDGLYKVTEAKMVRGKEGYKMCQYTLVRIPGQSPIPKRL